MSVFFTQPIQSDAAYLIARIFIGVCFIVHALGKLGYVGTGNMKGFAKWLKSLGVPYPEIQAYLAMGAELLGGISITLGLFMRLGLILCIATMLVAAMIGHKGGGYLITNNPPGNEYTINLIIICLILFLMGPGRYSLDTYIF